MLLRSRTLVATLLAIALFGCSVEPPSQPNVLLIMADDLGWHDVGYNGSEINTPTLDALAAGGIRFDRFYAHPYCSPTRSALMTGQAPLRNGILRPFGKNSLKSLPLARKIMPQFFKDAGYQTFLVGKWHLGHASRAQQPTARGFDHFYGHTTGGIGYWDKVHGGGYDWQRNGKTVREERYTTHLIAEEATRLIERRDPAKPLFMFASFNAPHLPNEASDEALAAYAQIGNPNRRIHAAMVSEFDRAVAQILQSLKDEGLYENTIVWFMSDNGGLIAGQPPDFSFAMIDRQGNPLATGDVKPERFMEFVTINATQGGSDNTPLQRGKGSVYEGGVRVPALVSWPEHIRVKPLNAMITAEDVLPTLLGLAGIATQHPQFTDGADQSDALLTQAEPSAHDYIAVGNDGTAYLSWPWKLIQPTRGGAVQLFQLADDPSEQHNLASQHADITERLTNLMNDFPRGEVMTSTGGIDPDFIWDPDFFGGAEDREPWADVVTD